MEWQQRYRFKESDELYPAPHSLHLTRPTFLINNRSLNAIMTRKFVKTKIFEDQQKQLVLGVSTRAIRVGFPNHCILFSVHGVWTA